MRREREALLVVAGVALFVAAVCWRLWTPIDGARRAFADGLRGVALLLVLGCGTYAWLRARGAGAAWAALAAGVAVVAMPAAAFPPWALLAVELLVRSPSPARAAAAVAGLALVGVAGRPADLAGVLALAAAVSARRWPYAAAAAAAAVIAAVIWPPALRWSGAAAGVGLLVPRAPGTVVYVGAVLLVGAVMALRKPSAATVALALVAAAGLCASRADAALLALCALGAEGLETVDARWLGVLGLAAAAALGCAVTLTTARPGHAQSALHDELVIAFFAWTASLWALWQLGARRTRVLVVAVAVIGVCDAWFARVPAVEQRFYQKPTERPPLT